MRADAVGALRFAVFVDAYYAHFTAAQMSAQSWLVEDIEPTTAVMAARDARIS